MNNEDYFKYYIQGSDHYLIPKDVFDELFNELVNWREENQELKRNCNIGNENLNFYREENQELKKQLEEYQLQNIDLRADIMIQKKSFPHKEIKDKTFYDLYDMPTYEDLLNQQKEFIEYLEDLIKQNETVVEVSEYRLPKNCSKLLIVFYKGILSKYKEITGVSNE